MAPWKKDAGFQLPPAGAGGMLKVMDDVRAWRAALAALILVGAAFGFYAALGWLGAVMAAAILIAIIVGFAWGYERACGDFNITKAERERH